MAHAAGADDHHHHHSVHVDDWPDDEHMGKASAGKIGMWIFLLSDALTFAGFLLAYGILRGGTEQWIPDARPGGGEVPALGIYFTALLTFLLICSSVTMVLAHTEIMEKNRAGAKKFLGLTILGGALFLFGQYLEYFGGLGIHSLIDGGLVWGESHYATTFYLVTSFHGAHVLTGVIYLSIMWFKVARGKFDDGDHNQIEILGLFWHFVDLVWIIVFTIIYLIPE
ncbi:MAG: cytochrome c oxidase subunit 3 [Myxococcota bacterium]|jgi:cytochrome c oxidase subunit 3